MAPQVMDYPPVIETKQLFLRALQPSDKESLKEVLSDEQSMKYYPHPFSDQEVERWIEWNRRNYEVYQHGLWAVVLKGSDRVIGDCGITMQLIEGEEVPEIGFHIVGSCCNLGYATEAAIACREYAFHTLGYPQVFSYMAAQNIPSQRVAQKMGMHVYKHFMKEGVAHVAYVVDRGQTGDTHITDRLILRPWLPSDAENLFFYAQDPLVGPIAGWAPHTSVEYSRIIIDHVLAVPQTYAVCLKEDNKAIGSVGLMVGRRSNIAGLSIQEAEIGYWIGVPFWGRGLIPEAVRALMRYAFQTMRLEKLWCGYFEGNIKSKRVQEKCGFRYQYTNKDLPWPLMNDVRTEHITCITKATWETMNSIETKDS